MGCKIKVTKKGFLVYRLHWNKQTSWEGTSLLDTPANRKRVEDDEKWIRQQRPPLVRKSRERDYKQHFHRHILPRLGEVTLSETTLTTRLLMNLRDYLLHDAPRIKKGLKG